LFGPQSNRIGIFYFSASVAAEDLGVTAQSIRRALKELGSSFGWLFDAAARVLYVPTYWRWNAPDHDKVLRGNLKDLNEVPPCALLEAFAQNLEYLDPKLHETFAEAIRIRMPKASASQEQSSTSKQKQKHGATRPEASSRAKANGANGPERATKQRSLAAEVVKNDLPLDSLIEELQSYCSFHNVNVTRAEATSLLSDALAERRAMS
jgi:hypothetical protein